LAVAIEGATLVKEHQGLYYNVLVYKQQCAACEYHAPANSYAIAMLTVDTYDTQGFACPCCSNYQAVRIQLELREEVAGLVMSEE